MSNKKTILLTGSEGALGTEIFKKFTGQGWEVVGIDIKNGSLQNDYLEYINCDVTNREMLTEKINELETSGIEITVLFTAIGSSINMSFEDTDISVWQELLSVWLGGTTNVCAAIAPHMIRRKRGKIIVYSPDYKNADGCNILNATAAGTLHGFAKSFGTEVASDNVMVNVLYPSMPADPEKISDMVFYLADKDNYTTAQVISITGRD